MKLSRDDDYYKLIYNWVDDLDFIEGYEFLEAKSPNTDAFDHMHMEVKNVSGDVTVRLDANGIMITCGCGCLSSDEMEYFQVCDVQRKLNEMITKGKNEKDRFDRGMYPPNDMPWDMNSNIEDLFKRLGKMNDPEDRIDRELKRLTNMIDRIFDRINELEIEKREEYLMKLKEVLGKTD